MKLTIELNEETVHRLQELARWGEKPVGQVIENMLTREALNQYARISYPPAWKDLNQRQRQIAALICLNYTNMQIALRLNLSESTVKVDVAKIKLCLGLVHRNEILETLSWS